MIKLVEGHLKKNILKINQCWFEIEFLFLNRGFTRAKETIRYQSHSNVKLTISTLYPVILKNIKSATVEKSSD